MHIKKIFIESFGKLERLTLDLSEGLNVIYGENAIGKSSISAFIKYMLYGFSHANKRSVAENDKKHYLSWSNDQASGYIDLVSGGTSYKIVRKTTSKNEEVILYDMDKGEKVKKGQIIADGASTSGGEMLHIMTKLPTTVTVLVRMDTTSVPMHVEITSIS